MKGACRHGAIYTAVNDERLHEIAACAAMRSSASSSSSFGTEYDIGKSVDSLWELFTGFVENAVGSSAK